ncbi:MAG: tRNA (adenine-N1)-methyltransferase [Anaerolineales bacterium]|nr:tRNA (adenine-N1)-methyltransferase [Anaerolineales bacterium]
MTTSEAFPVHPAATSSAHSTAQPGNLVLLLSFDQKRFIIRLEPGRRTFTHLGAFVHDDLIGRTWGSSIETTSGYRALLLEPGLADLMRQLKRGTQIIYPKDAAYIVHRLSLRAGSRVIEAGTGSAGLTTALAWAVAPTGVVYTHETRPDVFKVARDNLERTGLLPFVRMYQIDIEAGFKASDVDAVFLDVREPWQYLAHVRVALRPGGFFASLVPTANQAIELLRGFDAHKFADVTVEELLLRPYKPSAERFRPDDALIAHTGFLIFARCISDEEDVMRWQKRERLRYEARIKSQVENEAEAARRAADREETGKRYPRLPLP